MTGLPPPSCLHNLGQFGDSLLTQLVQMVQLVLHYRSIRPV